MITSCLRADRIQQLSCGKIFGQNVNVGGVSVLDSAFRKSWLFGAVVFAVALAFVGLGTPEAKAGAAAPAATRAPAQAVDAVSITEDLNNGTLIPKITDIPPTFTFRSSCIKKTYVDGYWKQQLDEPTLIRQDNGLYVMYATCLNGLGVPTKTKITLKLIVRYVGDVRTISIRSIIDKSNVYRNCADIANRNGIIECIPPLKQ